SQSGKRGREVEPELLFVEVELRDVVSVHEPVHEVHSRIEFVDQVFGQRGDGSPRREFEMPVVDELFEYCLYLRLDLVFVDVCWKDRWDRQWRRRSPFDLHVTATTRGASLMHDAPVVKRPFK